MIFCKTETPIHLNEIDDYFNYTITSTFDKENFNVYIIKEIYRFSFYPHYTIQIFEISLVEIILTSDSKKLIQVYYTNGRTISDRDIIHQSHSAEKTDLIYTNYYMIPAIYTLVVIPKSQNENFQYSLKIKSDNFVEVKKQPHPLTEDSVYRLSGSFNNTVKGYP